MFSDGRCNMQRKVPIRRTPVVCSLEQVRHVFRNPDLACYSIASLFVLKQITPNFIVQLSRKCRENSHSQFVVFKMCFIPTFALQSNKQICAWYLENQFNTHSSYSWKVSFVLSHLSIRWWILIYINDDYWNGDTVCREYKLDPNSEII